jgi:hypothetical protein
VTEEFGFEQVFRDGRAVDRDEGLGGAFRFLVNEARHHLLTHTALAGDEDGGVGRCHALGKLDHLQHRRVARDHRALVVGDGSQYGGDQVGFGREGNEFLRARADRAGGRFGAHIHAARHDRDGDALQLVSLDQGADIQTDIDHEQIGPTAGPQITCSLFDRVHVSDLGSAVHGDLGGGGQLSTEAADDQYAHRLVSLHLLGGGVSCRPRL